MMEAWFRASEMTASSLAEQRLEQAAVGVEAAAVEHGVLHAQEAAEALLELPVHVLGAADEAHRSDAVAVAPERIVRGLEDRRVVGEARGNCSRTD